MSNNNKESACKEQRRNIKGKKMRDCLASLNSNGGKRQMKRGQQHLENKEPKMRLIHIKLYICVGA
jgi:hypothetical protein